MRSLTVSAGHGLVVCAGPLCAVEEVAIVAAVTEKELAGAWIPATPDGAVSTVKLIVDGHWSLSQRGADGAVSVHHGGTFTLSGDGVYTEKVLWATAPTRKLVGGEHRFKVTITDGIFRLEGMGNPWTGEWKRAATTAAEPVTPAAPTNATERRRAQLDFLLKEIPAQAGALLAAKGIDWNAVTDWARREMENVTTDAEFARLCQRLIARLRDGHARLEGLRAEFPDETAAGPAVAAPVQLVLGADSVLVLQSSPAAAAAGVKPGAVVSRIDDQPARDWLEAKTDAWLDRYCYSTRHHALASAALYGLSGAENSTFTLTLEASAGVSEPITLTRSKPDAVTPFRAEKQLPELKPLERQQWGRTASGFGYIRLRNTPGNLPEQLDVMLEGLEGAPGMILDMRGNSGGGCDHAAVFARFLAKGSFWGRLESQGAHPFAGPMVVIVDANCASAGETVGGQFGEDQRAYVIGPSPSAGMSSQKTRIAVPDGGFAVRVSTASNKGRFNRGRGLEGIGVTPHEIAPWKAEDLAAGIDSQIRRAEEVLTEGIPKGAIDYVPPVAGEAGK